MIQVNRHEDVFTYISVHVRMTTIYVCTVHAAIYERRQFSSWQWMQPMMLAPIRDFSCPSRSKMKMMMFWVKSGPLSRGECILVRKN